MTCGKDNITVAIERHELTSIDIDNMYLADGLCKANYNETHVFITTEMNECGTEFTETEQEFYYSNTLTATTPGSVITRKKSLLFKFRCAYSRLITVSGFKFKLPLQQVVIEESKSYQVNCA